MEKQNLVELAQKPRSDLTCVSPRAPIAGDVSPDQPASPDRESVEQLALTHSSRGSLSEYELNTVEQYEFENGPFSVLATAVRDNRQILVSMRSGHKLLGRPRAFDRHCNILLQNVKEMWTEHENKGDGKKGAVTNRERFMSNLLVRGDGVVVVLLS